MTQEPLIQLYQNKQLGYINYKGEFLVPIEFKGLRPLSEGLMGVKKGEKWGFWSVGERKQLLPLEYEEVEVFKEGLAAVKKDGQWGFINKKNEVVIDLEYEYTLSFSEGLAVVAAYTTRDSYHDFDYNKEQLDSLKQEADQLYQETQHQLEDQDYLSQLMSNPTILAYERAKSQQASKELLHGYINTKGDLVIDYQFDHAEAFQEGLAKVRFGEKVTVSVVSYNKEEGRPPSYQEERGMGDNLINKKGEVQLQQNKVKLYRHKDGVVVTYSYKGAGAYNSQLEEIISPQYQNLSYIGEGYFVAELEDSKEKKLIGGGKEMVLAEHQEGKWIVKPIYEYATLEYPIDKE